jgi:hypothetical protein
LTHFDVLHIYYVSEEGERAATYELFHSHPRERERERNLHPTGFAVLPVVYSGGGKEGHLRRMRGKKKGVVLWVWIMCKTV